MVQKPIFLSFILIILSTFFFNAGRNEESNSTYGRTVSKELSNQLYLGTDNKRYRISDFKGNYLFIYAGYISCSTICGKSMQTLKRIANLTKPDTKFIFLNVNYKNDEPEKINKYIRNFGDNFLGLQAADGTLGSLGKDLVIQYSKNSLFSESINHTDNIYLVNKKGILKLVYPSNLRNEEKILKDLNRLEIEDE